MDQAATLRTMIKGESARIRRITDGYKGGSYSSGTRPKVIAVTSGKGGVGKTNVVGNLAIVCQRKGKRVVIFDADLGLANIDIIMGLNPKLNIEHVIKGEKGLSDIIVRGPEGVAIIPASSGVEELVHLTEGHKLNLLSEFDTLDKMFDMLLIDTGAGISSNVVYFNAAAQERIVVVTPEPTSITDAYALMKVMYYQHGVKNFFLLLNMVKDEKQAKSVFESLTGVAARFLAGVSIEYVGFIPWDSLLKKAVGKREPIVCSHPEASSSAHFRDLADCILKRTEDIVVDGNIKFFWKRLMSIGVEQS